MKYRLSHPVLWGAVFACINLFFWYLIDGFRVIPVDMLDGRLIVAIHEHWYQVFSGRVGWKDIPQFWPLEGTLGFSDAFFLTSIPYSIARGLGADLYFSFMVMLLGIALIGYFSCYRLFATLFKFPKILSIFLSYLFLNTSLTHNAIAHSHPQLLIIWLLPLLILFLHAAFYGTGLLSMLLSVVSGLWLGLLFLTGYYISWYFIFFTSLAFLFWIIFQGFAQRLKPPSLERPFASFWRTMAERKVFVKLGLMMAFGGLSLIPFFHLYLPINVQYGERVWGEMRLIVPSFKEFFNQGTYNWMWSGLVQSLGWFSDKWPQARSMGFGPLFFALFVLCSGTVLCSKYRNNQGSEHILLVCVLICTILCCLCLNFRVGEFTLWKYMYQWVPGATAISFFHRLNFILLLPCLTIIGWALREVVWNPQNRIFGCCLGILVILEQQPSRVSDYAMRYHEAVSRTVHVQPPPPEAAVFYLRSSTKSEKWQFSQLDALFVAQQYGLRTVNGYSGIYPKNWWLYDPSESWYPQEVRRWIHLNGAQPSGLYELDWDTGRWTSGGG